MAQVGVIPFVSSPEENIPVVHSQEFSEVRASTINA